MRKSLNVDAGLRFARKGSPNAICGLVWRHSDADFVCCYVVVAAEEDADEPTASICWAEQLRLNTEVSIPFLGLF